MLCPKCKHDSSRVLESRDTENGVAIRRRRECEKCEHRFTTFERFEIASFLVVKKDGTREPYSREKLEKGIWIACGKRPVTQAQIDEMIGKLEGEWGANKKEIAADRIGNDVMRELKILDSIAYIRFASVYRNFRDVEELKNELSALIDKK